MNPKNVCFYIFLSIFFNEATFSQTREGFYDAYNYDLRNTKKAIPIKEGREDYVEYSIPPSFAKPQLPTPKNVLRVYEPSIGIPGTTQQNTGQNLNQSSQNANRQVPVNPLTGEVNTQYIQQKAQDDQIKRKRKEDALDQFLEEKPYYETPARRFQIIFLLTFPPALAISGGIAGALGIYKTFAGWVFMFTTASSVSTYNAYIDSIEFNKVLESKGIQPSSDETIPHTH
jgi:hypothetical protein